MQIVCYTLDRPRPRRPRARLPHVHPQHRLKLIDVKSVEIRHKRLLLLGVGVVGSRCVLLLRIVAVPSLLL